MIVRALVTGAGRGIGRASAIALAHAGYDVTLVARTPADLESAADAVRKAGREASVVAGDVTQPGTLDAAFNRAPVTLVVNAAGANHPEPFIDVPMERFTALMDLNVGATFHACQIASRHWLAEAQHGTIINLSSQMGHVGAVHRSVYCATKHAVEGLTKALAVELGPHGIRVLSIAPTFVETPMTASALADPAQREAIVSEIPLGFVGEAEDVAAAVVFAASKSARLLHGSSLIIDGGWTAK